MEIFSPGKLPNLVTLENMSHMRWSRNPVLARTLIEFGWVREFNEGVKRIYEEMEGLYLNPPVFSEPNDAAVLLTLENNIGTRALRQQESLEDRIGVDVMRSLNEYEIEAVRYAMSRGSVTTKALAEHLRKSSSLCAKTLKGLADKGLLEWHGSSRDDLSRFFTKSFGVSFNHYIRELRLKRAMGDLLYTDKPITQISFDNGFSSSSYFNQAFREKHGASPSEVREREFARNSAKKLRE